jgi:Rrf2 family protein
MRSLSQKTKYALRALQVLAREQARGPILISELAEKDAIPRKFLELILLELKNQGILQSKKGKGGGYFLRKAPEKVSLGQIVRIFDGPLAPLPCVSESAFMKCDDCTDEVTCGLRSVMKEVRDATAKVLDNTTLADLVKRADRLKDKKAGLMYYI